MPLSCWPGARWFCGGHASFMSMLNSFVHVVMYTYYMIAAMGPEYKVQYPELTIFIVNYP